MQIITKIRFNEILRQISDDLPFYHKFWISDATQFPQYQDKFSLGILSGPCLYLVHIENKNQEIYFDLFLILGIPAKPKAVELVNTWSVTENSGQGGFTVITPSNWPNMSQT